VPRRRSAILFAGALLAVATPNALAGGVSTAPTACDWAAFGHDGRHSFATSAQCSPISRSTVATLVPAWFTPMRDSVTASPTVAGATAYVGSWDGLFTALDVATGTVRWTFQTTLHAPTAFGRIVSSATVTSVHDPLTQRARQVVIFGGGSSIWVLDAASGAELASLDLDPRTPALQAEQEASASPPVVEVESSPVLVTTHGQTRILVGLDVHNRPGVGRTGLIALALQARPHAPWALDPLWKFDPETASTSVGTAGLTVGSGQGFGCGGVWSSPASDGDTVVFGTASCSQAAAAYDAGENYAEEMVALNVADGSLRWTYRPADELPGRDARVADAQRDADFGASPNLFTLDGRPVVGEGRKTGDYVVRDLASGAPVSTTQAGPEGHLQRDFAVGGFLGTTAVEPTGGGGARVVGATAVPVPHSAGDLDKDTWAVRALDPRTGTVSWTYRLAGPSYGHTSLVGGVAFVPDTTTSSLVALDSASGLPLWQAPVVGPPSSTAVIAGDTVLLGTGTRETDLEFKAFNSSLQDAFAGSVGASPLSPASGVQAWRLVPSPGQP
jgi:outer membrane protein assembly factor BamB